MYIWKLIFGKWIMLIDNGIDEVVKYSWDHRYFHNIGKNMFYIKVKFFISRCFKILDFLKAEDLSLIYNNSDRRVQ